MTIRELYAALEERLPRTLSCPWDNDGISCAPDLDAFVTGILITLDPTEDAVDVAVESGCNVILAHHPMLFGGLKAVDGGDTGSRKVIRLIRHGITVMSFHTRLDAVDGGVNDVLAARLGISDVTPFGCNENPAGKPIGRVGDLSEAVTPEAFAETIKTALGVPAVVYAGNGGLIRRVAVLGGSGGDDVAAAAAAGAQAFVTGELKYHQLCDAPYGTVNLFAAGHYHTEAPVLDRLDELCAEICPDANRRILRKNRIAVL